MEEDKFKSVDNVVIDVSIKNVRVVTADGEFQARDDEGNPLSYFMVVADINTTTRGAMEYVMAYQIEWHKKDKKFIMFQADWSIYSYDLVELIMQSYSWDHSYMESFKDK